MEIQNSVSASRTASCLWFRNLKKKIFQELKKTITNNDKKTQKLISEFVKMPW